MERSAIVVAGGAGTRMNSAVPKQFLPLAGLPMVMHSLTAFNTAFPGITLVLALPADHFEAWRALCGEYHFDLPHRLVPGGSTRFHSVKNALAEVSAGGLTAVHDGARPLVSANLIRRTFAGAETGGACIPVIPVSESVRHVEGDASRPFDRGSLRIVQTPQVFHTDLLKKAYEQDFRDDFTDDATVVERLGAPIRLTAGEATNIKVTLPSDLAYAGWLLSQRLN